MLIAIAPLVPVVVAAAAIVAGLFAFLRKKKGPTTTGELPPPPSGPAVEPAKPTVDPRFFRVSMPYVGEATGGPSGWTWATGKLGGSAATPIDAIVSLLNAIGTREDTDPPDVVPPKANMGRGTIGGGGNPTLAWSLRDVDQVPGTPVGESKQWRLEEPAVSVAGKLPLPPTLLAEGKAGQGYDAIMAMIDKAAEHIDWLMREGAGAPAPAQDFHGLVVAGNTVAVADMARWAAHASPRIVALVDQGRNAAQIFDELLGAPGDASLSGKKPAQVIAASQRILDSVIGGRYMHPAAPDAALAAVLVGVEPPRVGEVLPYKGKALLVRPSGNEWQWLVFEKQRGLDADAIGNGTAPTKPAAIRRARFVVDEGK